MFNPLLTAKQQEVVVFPVWNALPYSTRLLTGFHLIAAGFLLQYLWFSVPIVLGFSFLLVLVGNLFFVVNGYDNRIRFGTYTAAAGWEAVSDEKIAEIERLTKQMKRWDRSWIDASNMRGGFALACVCVTLGWWLLVALSDENIPTIALAIDAFLLILPHFVMGKRSIQTQPGLAFKLKLFKKLAEDKYISPLLSPHRLEYLLLLHHTSDECRYPSDVKIRVALAKQPAHFLGLYGQIVINRVSDQQYPYFYVVIVAKKHSGLQQHFEACTPPSGITKEYKTEGEVDVLVLRQTTASNSGYHTPHSAMRNILIEGVKLGEQVVAK